MILAVVGVAVAFNISVYLVLATFLSENKRKASASDFPELKGLLTKGNTRVAWSRARSSLAARSLSPNSQPLGVLRRLKSLCSPRGGREQLPLFSIECTDFTPCRGNSLYKAHSWPPSNDSSVAFPPSPLRPLSRTSALCDGPSMTSATAAPVPVMSALPEQAAAAGDAAADGAQGKLLRALYKQHYGVGSVTPPQKEPLGAEELSLHCFLEQPLSPCTPLDTSGSLDALVQSPFEGFNLRKPSSASQPKTQTAEATVQPRLPDLGSAKSGLPPDLAPLPPPPVSAFAFAASCPPNFFGSEDGDEDTQPLDCRRQVKSFEPVLDILLDMSVASLLTSSSVSGQLSSGPNLARAHIRPMVC